VEKNLEITDMPDRLKGGGYLEIDGGSKIHIPKRMIYRNSNPQYIML